VSLWVQKHIVCAHGQFRVTAGFIFWYVVCCDEMSVTRYNEVLSR